MKQTIKKPLKFIMVLLPLMIVGIFGDLSPIMLIGCFLMNGGFGIVFGWLYRKYGIQYGMPYCF